jgi:hypothetical protein
MKNYTKEMKCPELQKPLSASEIALETFSTRTQFDKRMKEGVVAWVIYRSFGPDSIHVRNAKVLECVDVTDISNIKLEDGYQISRLVLKPARSGCNIIIGSKVFIPIIKYEYEGKTYIYEYNDKIGKLFNKISIKKLEGALSIAYGSSVTDTFDGSFEELYLDEDELDNAVILSADLTYVRMKVLFPIFKYTLQFNTDQPEFDFLTKDYSYTLTDDSGYVKTIPNQNIKFHYGRVGEISSVEIPISKKIDEIDQTFHISNRFGSVDIILQPIVRWYPNENENNFIEIPKSFITAMFGCKKNIGGYFLICFKTCVIPREGDKICI